MSSVGLIFLTVFAFCVTDLLLRKVGMSKWFLKGNESKTVTREWVYMYVGVAVEPKKMRSDSK